MAELVELNGKKFEADNKADARRAAELLGFLIENEKTTEEAEAKGPAQSPDATFQGTWRSCPRCPVRSIEKKRTTSRPSAPFITSTLAAGGVEQALVWRPADDANRPDLI